MLYSAQRLIVAIVLFAWFHCSASISCQLIAQEPVRIVDFERDVLPILKSRCSECHEGDNAKNGFIVLDRDSFTGYIDESGAENSSVWTDYLTAESKSVDPESLIMPPEEPLPAAELAVLKMWLDEGSHWPELLSVSQSEVATPTVDASAKGSFNAANLMAAVGYFHPAIVHFPIALILVAGAASLISFVSPGDGAKRLAYTCIVLGAITAIGSAVAGWGFAPLRGYSYAGLAPLADMSPDQALLHRHRWFGVATTVFTCVVALIAVAGMRAKRTGVIWRLGVVLCALLVGIVGHQGGEVVYGDILHKAMDRLGLNESATGDVSNDSTEQSTKPDSTGSTDSGSAEQSSSVDTTAPPAKSGA